MKGKAMNIDYDEDIDSALGTKVRVINPIEYKANKNQFVNKSSPTSIQNGMQSME
jgi:hypothetical protein